MSDVSTSIVPLLCDYPDRFAKAQEIIDWLIEIKAIKPIKSDCILSSEPGYAIDIGAKLLTNESEYLPFNLKTNGLEVVTKRSIFDAGENGLDSFVCPKCNEDILYSGLDLQEYSENGTSILTCPLCNRASEINQYRIEPEWGFSNLGFTFWNWSDLTAKFIEDFEKKLQCKVKVVESHI